MVAMHYVGLDVHAKRSSLCILDSCGKTVKQLEVRGTWPQLLERVAAEVPRPFAVCYEASCGYGYLHEKLSMMARAVSVAHPGQLRLIFKSKKKNDRVDAGKLAKILYLDAVPAVRSSKQARVPSVWDPGHVARILDAIDRSNPCGKRDYAIILLVTRLGLRSIDVKRLEFADFDWPGNRLFVVQAKTGHRVQLPLLKEVGWAVIDYIRHGRPVCDCPQVFLRHLAPIGPFSDQDHLHQILVKHARVAHVPVSDKRRHGMHSLRHTLATKLMEDGTPVEQIADILGHQSVRSTGVYLKSSLGLLAKCALDPDEPARQAPR